MDDGFKQEPSHCIHGNREIEPEVDMCRKYQESSSTWAFFQSKWCPLTKNKYESQKTRIDSNGQSDDPLF